MSAATSSAEPTKTPPSDPIDLGAVLLVAALLLTVTQVYSFSAPVDRTGTGTREDVLIVGTDVRPGYEPLYLARTLGYLDHNRLRLAEFGASTEVLRGMRNGTLRVAALTMAEALSLRESGVDVRLLLITDFSAGEGSPHGAQRPSETADVLVYRAELAEQHPQTLLALADAWFRALSYLRAEPDKAIAAMAPRLELSPAAAAAAFEKVRLPTREENAELMRSGAAAWKTARGVVDVMHAAGVVRDQIELEGFFSTRFVEAAP